MVGGTYFKNRPLKSNERYHEPPPNTVLELTKAGKGKIIPIHIRIERVDSDNAVPLIVDKTVQTNGFYAGGRYGLERQIVKIPLRRGHYRIAALVEDDVNLPEGVETVFAVHGTHELQRFQIRLKHIIIAPLKRHKAIYAHISQSLSSRNFSVSSNFC